MKSIFTLLIIFSFFLCKPVYGQINHDWSFGIGSKKSEGSGGSVGDHEGNVYILMIMKDTVDVDPGPANVQIVPEFAHALILTKYDAYGNLVFGYPFYTDNNSGGAVLEARNNRVQVSILFHDSLVYEHNNIRERLFYQPGRTSAIITLDLNGNITQSYFYAVPEDHYVETLVSLDDGRKLMAGTFNDTLIFNPQSPVRLISTGGEDAYIMMTDANYIPLWYQLFSGSGYDYFSAINIWKNERIYFAGGYEDTLRVTTINGPLEIVSGGELDGFYGYMTLAGAIEKIFAMSGPAYDDVRDIQPDVDGNMYVCGEFEETLNFANPPQAPAFRTALGESDPYLAKYNEDGNLLWIDIFPCTGYGGIHNIELKRGDELYISGSFTQKGDLDPGPDSIIVVTGYDSSPFISKLNTNGELVWSTPFLTNEVAGIRALTILTEQSRIVVNGFFYDSLHCGTVTGENWLNTDFGADCFVASYSEENVTTANQDDISSGSTEKLELFPNPATDFLTIRNEKDLTEVSLYNSSGKLIHQFQDVQSNQIEIKLGGLPSGLYYIATSSADKLLTGKLIKE